MAMGNCLIGTAASKDGKVKTYEATAMNDDKYMIMNFDELWEICFAILFWRLLSVIVKLFMFNPGAAS